eukprot:13529-Heterococcus_DN1.PRE.3
MQRTLCSMHSAAHLGALQHTAEISRSSLALCRLTDLAVLCCSRHNTGAVLAFLYRAVAHQSSDMSVILFTRLYLLQLDTEGLAVDVRRYHVSVSLHAAHYSNCHNERIRCSKARYYSRTLTWCGSIMRVRSLIGTAIGHEESKMCCAPKYQRLKGSTLMCCNAMSALRNQDVRHAKPGLVLSGAHGLAAKVPSSAICSTLCSMHSTAQPGAMLNTLLSTVALGCVSLSAVSAHNNARHA